MSNSSDKENEEDLKETVVIYNGKRYEEDRPIKEILLSLVERYKKYGKL